MNLYDLPHNPVAYSISVGVGNTWTATTSAANLPLWFCQISNNSGSGSVTVTLNGSQSFVLTHGAIQIFNGRDVDITSLGFTNSLSGATTQSLAIVASYTGSVAPTVVTT